MARCTLGRPLWIATSVACGLVLACTRADAQVTLPAPRAPLPAIGAAAAPVLVAVPDAQATKLVRDARRLRLLELVRAHPQDLERNRAGELVVRGELLAEPSNDEALALIEQSGFRVRERRDIDALGLTVAVLEPPAALAVGAALRTLRRLDPDGRYDYHHVYLDGASTPDAAPPSQARPVEGPSPGVEPALERHVRVGLIDAGVAVGHPRLAAARVSTTGCRDGRQVPSAHGTAVASVLLDALRAAQAVAGDAEVELSAVDVYCGEPTGGSVLRVAEALGVFARARVAVVNVSLVGPRNVLLERAVAAMVARGHVIVAAVGNDGPAARPLYPAAYPGVVGVTAVDRDRRVLLEAGRGEAVDFAALGADVDAAAVPEGSTRVRGTSFAAPVVAGLLAARITEPFPTDAAQAVAELGTRAVDLGRKGRDPVYGHGLLEPAPLQSARVSPTR